MEHPYLRQRKLAIINYDQYTDPEIRALLVEMLVGFEYTVFEEVDLQSLQESPFRESPFDSFLLIIDLLNPSYLFDNPKLAALFSDRRSIWIKEIIYVGVQIPHYRQFSSGLTPNSAFGTYLTIGTPYELEGVLKHVSFELGKAWRAVPERFESVPNFLYFAHKNGLLRTAKLHRWGTPELGTVSYYLELIRLLESDNERFSAQKAPINQDFAPNVLQEESPKTRSEINYESFEQSNSPEPPSPNFKPKSPSWQLTWPKFFKKDDGSFEYKVWYGTNRSERIEQPSEYTTLYADEIDSIVHFGTCTVFVPKSHKIGSTGSPWWKRLITLTDDRLKLLTTREVSSKKFVKDLKKACEKLADDAKAGVIFIHGYNVSFEEAAIRAAQLGVDLQIKGPMAFFSWPSKGDFLDYLADGATIEACEDQINEFINIFASKSGLTTVHIIAHSMGNRPLLRIINQIIANAEKHPHVSFGHFILAAPDVDARVFAQLAKEYKKVAKHTTLYISDKDRALSASGYLTQFPRAGFAPPITVVPDIDTIFAGDIDMSLLGHGYVAEAREVLTDIHSLIHHNTPANARMGLYWVDLKPGEGYWTIAK
ncbi:alpha/beta hydrolase [Dyadobacter chenwenxiniae]|uniref:Alpha/beta hydrolase n=1 Tax=Dyadobacter chenwenxiniae TaxID=2906456 RepID=A0A9X1TBR3_9BACT|nr:alpha/beta hydrolase [Dyadobacter chenwenxiniae]MCF0060146.1 alpha/beta hydrolase [Dyadobacter chenwenxiniae]UON85883.1 alpha/beta hydrolase [Dyadobacter chenwenxiniae]